MILRSASRPGGWSGASRVPSSPFAPGFGWSCSCLLPSSPAGGQPHGAVCAEIPPHTRIFGNIDGVKQILSSARTSSGQKLHLSVSYRALSPNKALEKDQIITKFIFFSFFFFFFFVLNYRQAGSNQTTPKSVVTRATCWTSSGIPSLRTSSPRAPKTPR